jgi:hypothetical protein
MKFHPEQETELLALIKRWCRITGHPWYPGLAQGAVDNMEDFQDDDIAGVEGEYMKAGHMIDEYLYWVANPPWQEDPEIL